MVTGAGVKHGPTSTLDAAPARRPVPGLVCTKFICAIACALLLLAACAPGKTVKRTGPVISLSADSWTFATLKRGEKTAGEITVNNAGTDTLSITLYPTCDCLEARMDTDRLAPGESLPIHLTYLGDEIKNKVTKTLYVDSNDQVIPRIAFEVIGKVVAGDGPHLVVTTDPLLLDPEDPDYPEAKLQLHNMGEQHLEIIDVRCFGCTVDRWEPVSLAGPGGLMGAPIWGCKVRKLEGWTGTRWIEIETDDPVYPVKKVAILEL